MKRLWLILLILVVVGGAGFGGWRLWENRSTKNNSQQTSKDPSEGGTYLVIREWGVRFKLGDLIKDSFYTYVDNKNVHLTTKNVRKVEGCQNREVMGLQRAKRGEIIGPSVVDEILVNNPSKLKKIDEYYYLFNASPFNCAQSGNKEGTKLLESTRSTFDNAVSTLEKIPY